MSKHTEGPWIYEPSSLAGGRNVNCATGGKVCMAYDYVREGGTDERNANARLIAAAPELLEAAQAIAKHLWNADGPVYDALRAAIDKATGDESCTECGDDADDGEGWDGKCGNCADREVSA